MNTTFVFDAIGTSWNISFEHSRLIDVTELKKEIIERIEEFDKNYSRFRDDSLVTKMSKSPGAYNVPEDFKKLFDMYATLFKLTDGKMTPAIGTLMEDIGYDSSYRLTSKRHFRRIPNFINVTSMYKSTLIIQEEVLLDLGAAGKGYLVDIVADIMKSFNVVDYLINAGGDIAHHSSSKIKELIGLEHPDYDDEVIGIATIYNKSICGSAGNRRKWGSYNHIIDPMTQQSPDTIKAIWVVANKALEADAITTALYFAEPYILESEFSFEYFILYQDFSFKKSNLFPAEVFIKQEQGIAS